MSLRPATSAHLRLLAALGVAGGLVMAACGGGDEPQTVSYAASSSESNDIEVVYSTANGDITELVTSPWTLDVEQSGDFEALLEVRNPGLGGSVQCEVSGELFPAVAASGEAVALCLASVFSSGSSVSVGALTDAEDFIRDVNGAPVAPLAPVRQRAEAESISDAPGGVLLGGQAGVYRLDTGTGVVEQVPASDGFARPLSTAISEDGTVYAVNSDGNVLEVLEAGAGEPSVFASFDNSAALAGVWVIDAMVLLYEGRDDVIVAHDEAGEEQWRYAFPERPNAVSKRVYVENLGDGRIVVGSGELGLVGLDLASGQTLFAQPIPDLMRHNVLVDSNLFVSASSLSGGTDSTTVFRVAELVDSQAPTIQTVGIRIVADASGNVFADEVDRISQLDPVTFEVIASIDLPGRSLLAASADRVFVSRPLGRDSTEITISAIPIGAFG